MNQKISVSIPHSLTQEEAKSRLVKGIEQAKSGVASNFGQVQDTWNGNHLDFRLTAMGQDVTGNVEVEPSSVRVEIDVPWVIAMLVEKLRPEIEAHGRRMLEQK